MTLGSLNSTTSNAAVITPREVARNFDDATRAAEGLDAFLDSGGDRGALYEAARRAQEGAGGDKFLAMLASLIQQGVIGTEKLEVRGETYTSFLDTRIAAPDEIARAPRARVDLLA